MFTDAKDLLAQVSGPGDLAVVLLAGSAGFVVEAGTSAIGFLAPGEVSVLAATVAMGAKKATDQVRKGRRAHDRARQAINLLASIGLSTEVRRLR